MDYHSYHAYAEEEAPQRGRGKGRIGEALRAALRWIARPTPSPVLLNDGKRRGYSTLGSGSGLRRPAECPFPTAPANDPDRRQS